MKGWGIIVAITVFAIVAVVDIVHDFVANDTLRYFREQPRRLLLVGSIVIGGGLAALVFERLSPHVRRRMGLYTLGSAALFLMVVTSYLLFEFAGLSPLIGASDARRAFILVPLCLATIIFLLWCEFFQVFKKRVD